MCFPSFFKFKSSTKSVLNQFLVEEIVMWISNNQVTETLKRGAVSKLILILRPFRQTRKKAREVAIGHDRKYLIKHLPLINFKAKVYNTGDIHHMYDLNYILTYIFKSSFKFCFRCVTLDTIIFFIIHIDNVYRIPNLMPGYGFLFRILMMYNSTTQVYFVSSHQQTNLRRNKNYS